MRPSPVAIAQVAIGEREKLAVFGNDYPTPGEAGFQDFIRVDNLAKGTWLFPRITKNFTVSSYKSRYGESILSSGNDQGF